MIAIDFLNDHEELVHSGIGDTWEDAVRWLADSMGLRVVISKKEETELDKIDSITAAMERRPVNLEG